MPIAFVLFFCHVYGLGLLGLMCISADAAHRRDQGRSWWRAGLEAAASVSVLALPFLAMALWPMGSGGRFAFGWFEWDAMVTVLYEVLRDRWGPFDVATLEIAVLILLFAFVSPKLGFSRRLGSAAILLAIGFVLLPRYILDSAYADIRLLPFVFALSLLAIRLCVRPPTSALKTFLERLPAPFFWLRMVANTASFAIAANDQRAKLEGAELHPARCPRRLLTISG